MKKLLTPLLVIFLFTTCVYGATVKLLDNNPKLVIDFTWQNLDWIFEGNTWTHTLNSVEARDGTVKNVEIQMKVVP